MGRQLPLGLRLQPTINYDDFVVGPNAAAVAIWRDSAEAQVWLSGSFGTGKTHLLQAACNALAENGLAVAYVPLREFAQLEPGLLEGLEAMALVGLDDVEAIGGHPAWEEALFAFYNRARAGKTLLRMTAAKAPRGAGIVLNDLRSRLSAGPVIQLKALSDADKHEALRRRAAQLGLDLPLEVGRYLLERHARDMQALFAILERLDRASLAAQRRLTVPFVRDLLST